MNRDVGRKAKLKGAAMLDYVPRRELRRLKKLSRRQLGMVLEDRILRIFKDKATVRPYWLTHLEKTTPEVECRKVDFLAKTDRGPISLQIKSSEEYARAFAQETRGSGIVVSFISPLAPDFVIFRRVMSVLQNEYEQMGNNNRPRRGRRRRRRSRVA